MKIDLNLLLAHSFFTALAKDATAALYEARGLFAEEPGAKSFSYEVLVPPAPTRDWFEGKLLAKLVYYCQSTRSRLPDCRGVFVSFFVGDRLFCVAASEVVRFGGELLGKTSAELVKEFGTGELRTALREPIGLLGGGEDPQR